MPDPGHQVEVTGRVVRMSWKDFLPSLPEPVLAFGKRSLYLVMLHGSGFTLPIEGSAPALGFCTSFIVSAASIREAEAKARIRCTREWIRRGALRASGTHPAVDIESIEALSNHFSWRSGGGFLLYNKLAD